MGIAASSWGKGKFSPEEIRKIEHRNLAKQPVPQPGLIACHECKDGVLRPHGGHGLCQKHYAAWRRATVRGDCSRCPATGVHLSLLDPPVCTPCYRRERRGKMTEREKEDKRAADREFHRRKRQQRPGQRTAYEKKLRADDPEKYAAILARRRERWRTIAATETPEEREVRLAKAKWYRQNRGLSLKKEGEKHRSRLDETRRELPRKTRVVGLSRYLHVEPEVTTRKLPEQTGVFTDALAARRTEARPDKKYRRRPRAA